MLQISQFKCLKDNYGFLIKELTSNKVICIDTPDANEIIAYAHKNNLKIDEVWNTHWHPDHAGGNQAIKDEFGALLKGPEEVLKHGFPIDEIMKPNESFKLGNEEIEIIDLSGHTIGQIGYYFKDSAKIFVGDAIFVLGCGRLFEGDAKMAHNSLSRLSELPDETDVYCAHEYSLANAKFCASLNLSNSELAARIIEIEDLTAKSIPTVPTKIGIEKATSPFMLADKENLSRELDLANANDTDIFAMVRGLKDKF